MESGYFMGLLGGKWSEWEKGKEGGEEREISKEEIREVVLKLREEKAIGGVAIPNEA